MVDGLGGGLVETGVDGLLEVGNVPDVGGGAAVGGGPDLVLLVELVVEQEEGHGVIDQPALVGVGVAVVGRAGDDGGVDLVGHVHDGEGVLVEVEADLAAPVLCRGALVDDALGVVDVAVLGDAAGGGGLGGVGDVNDEHAARAGGVAGVGAGAAADGVDEVLLLVRDEVVGRAEAAEVGGQVRLLAEDLGLEEEGVPPGLDLEELLEVEDLEAVAVGLGADVGVVADDLDVSPACGGRLGVEAAEVLELAAEGNLDEGDAVGLTDDAELAARPLVGPAPHVVAGLGLRGEILVAQEAVEVHVVAGELVGARAGLAVLASLDAGDLAVEGGTVKEASGAGLIPLLGLDVHELLHDAASGGDAGGHGRGAKGSSGDNGSDLHDCGGLVVNT